MCVVYTLALQGGFKLALEELCRHHSNGAPDDNKCDVKLLISLLQSCQYQHTLKAFAHVPQAHQPKQAITTVGTACCAYSVHHTWHVQLAPAAYSCTKLPTSEQMTKHSCPEAARRQSLGQESKHCCVRTKATKSRNYQQRCDYDAGRGYKMS